MAKFYITGLYHTAEFNDRTLPPIEVEADSRLLALTRIGATVWTEEEWTANNGCHMYGISEEEMRTIHTPPVPPELHVAPCGKRAWSYSVGDLTCSECIALRAATETI